MKRWIRSILKHFAYLGTLIATKAFFLLAVAILSFVMTMASFVFAPLATLAYAAAMRVFGSTVVTTVAEATEVRARNQRLAADNSDLRSRNQDLTARNRQLDRQLDAQRIKTKSTAQRAATRATRASTRSIAAIPVESVPLLGVSTIIATTAWDIHDTCRLLEDMDEILLAFGEPPVQTGFRSLCQSIPVLEAHAKHYGQMTVADCRAAAVLAKERVFEIAILASEEVPDLIRNDEDFDQDVRDAAQREFEIVNEVCDCIADLICDVNSLGNV